MGQVSAGEFTKRLTLMMPQVSQGETYGDVQESFQTVATVWGKSRPLSGREFFAAAQVVAGAQVEFTIWWRTDIDETARILMDGVEYQVLYIAEVGFREALKILAKKP